MEQLEGKERSEGVDRQRLLDDFVTYVAGLDDPRLSAFVLTLYYDELEYFAKSEFVKVIESNIFRNNPGREAAFNLLRDQTSLDWSLKEALLNAIARDADKTTCSLVLQSVPD